MVPNGSSVNLHQIAGLILIIFRGIVLHLPVTTSAVVPSSDCYVVDNSSHLLDFTDWIGRPFEYDGKDADLVVRFCKDVERRSQMGYVDFGRYASYDYFVVGSGTVGFVQGFYGGDLMKCEDTYDKMGRNALVNIICGNCSNVACKGEFGCICNATYDLNLCRVFIDLAIPCVKHGPRVFEGFTVGFNPRTSEVVHNGMTQIGYEKHHNDFSFGTEQSQVSLYMTAISTLSSLVGKPTFKVYPDKGLEVRLSGSGASGSSPTTLSPTNLILYWRCKVARDFPYQVTITIPLEGYDSVEFILSKLCDFTQAKEGGSSSGWVTFGVLSCIFIVLATISCCAGFIYKISVEHQRGLDALPGIAVLSACLEAVSGPQGYMRAENGNDNFVNPPSWDHVPGSAPASQRTNERRYGSL